MCEVGMVKNECGQSCDGTLKLTVTEDWTDGINWSFACWYKWKLKGDRKYIGWLWSKMGVASLVTGL